MPKWYNKQMKRTKFCKSIHVTLVTCGIIGVLGLFSLPLSTMAQVGTNTVDALKNTVNGPIDELKGPVEDLTNQISNKVSGVSGNIDTGGITNWLQRNGITFESIKNWILNMGEWVKEKMNLLNTPALVTWAVDFIKRIILLIIELVSKVISFI